MDDNPIQNTLIELRLNAWIVRPSDARSALCLSETREAIQQTQVMIERSDRLIALLSMLLCWPPPQIKLSARVLRGVPSAP